METARIISPLDEKTVEKLKTGMTVLISGIVYQARDAAHRRLIKALNAGEKLPFDIKGQTVYYMGPSPAPPGRIIGAAGPTTSARMDTLTPRLLSAGLRAMIGKGNRSPAVREAIKKYKGIYFASIGGAGALLSQCIRKVDIVAYEDLGVEAVRRLIIEDFPAIVADDMHGTDLFEVNKAVYRRDNV